VTELARATVSRKRLVRRRVWANHSYWAVLGAIFVGFFVAALTPDAAWATSLLVLVQCATLLIAIWTAGWGVTDRTISFGLAVIGAAGASVNLFVQGVTLTSALNIFAGLLTAAIAVVVAAGAVSQGEVNTRSVAGAICVYILLGMIFLFAYSVISTLGTGPFFAQGTDGSRALRLYFSYTTLATLGYGDYTAAGNLGHTIAVLEALLGQLYLVTVVAVVVTRLGRPTRPLRDE
jgi:hypothetical protein